MLVWKVEYDISGTQGPEVVVVLRGSVQSAGLGFESRRQYVFFFAHINYSVAELPLCFLIHNISLWTI